MALLAHRGQLELAWVRIIQRGGRYMLWNVESPLQIVIALLAIMTLFVWVLLPSQLVAFRRL